MTHVLNERAQQNLRGTFRSLVFAVARLNGVPEDQTLVDSSLDQTAFTHIRVVGIVLHIVCFVENLFEI